MLFEGISEVQRVISRALNMRARRLTAWKQLRSHIQSFIWKLMSIRAQRVQKDIIEAAKAKEASKKEKMKKKGAVVNRWPGKRPDYEDKESTPHKKRKGHPAEITLRYTGEGPEWSVPLGLSHKRVRELENLVQPWKRKWFIETSFLDS